MEATWWNHFGTETNWFQKPADNNKQITSIKVNLGMKD